ncbi:hypothetical protein DL96DRAFT_1819800 [Flagelloscypha sp. PMI_526]|nr:hypothetical protein DL96DRAFT_1819800 [Flagelloscypha sp. PMI_526]
MTFPHLEPLPPEIWIIIYYFLAKTCNSQAELVSYFRVERLAHSSLRIHLFETLVLGWTESKSLPQWQIVQMYASSKRDFSSPIRRVYMPQGGWYMIFSAILSKASSTIERLALMSTLSDSPKERIIPLVLSLSQLRFLETTWGNFIIILKTAQFRVPCWVGSLTRLSLQIDFEANLQEIKFVDWTQFISLTEICISTNEPSRVLSMLVPKLSPSVSLITVCPIPGYRSYTLDEMTYGSRPGEAHVVYYIPLHERKSILEHDISCRERSCMRGDIDAPLNDWLEVTASDKLQFWGWARKAMEAKKNTFKRSHAE